MANKGKKWTQASKDRLSAAQKARLAGAEARERAREAARLSWAKGLRCGDRITWTPEMDAKLIALYQALPFRKWRVTAAKVIGVCDKACLKRRQELGLSKPRLGRPRAKKPFTMLKNGSLAVRKPARPRATA